MTNSVDIKAFADVARAGNSVYMYVTQDATATVLTAGYFNDAQLVGNVQVGDIIFLNSLASSGGGFMVLTVSAVSITNRTITVTQVLPTPTPPGPEPTGDDGEPTGDDGEPVGDA